MFRKYYFIFNVSLFLSGLLKAEEKDTPTTLGDLDPDSMSKIIEQLKPEDRAHLRMAGMQMQNIQHAITIRTINFSDAKTPEETRAFFERFLDRNPHIESLKITGLNPKYLPIITSIIIKKSTIEKSLKNLYDVDFSGNFLSDTQLVSLFMALKALPSLVRLNITQNNLGIQSAKTLVMLKNLTSLNMSACEVGDEIINIIIDLKKLRVLCVGTNKITSRGIKAITKLRELQYLDLSSNRFNLQGVKELSRMAQLTSLKLSENNLGDEGVEALAPLSKLTSLSANANKIGPRGGNAIASLKNLQELNLSNNRLGNEGIAVLASLENLVLLNVAWNGINVEGIDAIISHKKLKILNAAGNKACPHAKKDFQAALPLARVIC